MKHTLDQTKLWYFRAEDGFTVPRQVWSQAVKLDVNKQQAKARAWVHVSGDRIYVAAGTADAAQGRIAYHLLEVLTKR